MDVKGFDWRSYCLKNWLLKYGKLNRFNFFIEGVICQSESVSSQHSPIADQLDDDRTCIVLNGWALPEVASNFLKKRGLKVRYGDFHSLRQRKSISPQSLIKRILHENK